MKMTPVGQRWGDRVKKALKNPYGFLSKITRRFSAMKTSARLNPKRYSLDADYLGLIFFDKKDKNADTEYVNNTSLTLSTMLLSDN